MKVPKCWLQGLEETVADKSDKNGLRAGGRLGRRRVFDCLRRCQILRDPRLKWIMPLGLVVAWMSPGRLVAGPKKAIPGVGGSGQIRFERLPPSSLPRFAEIAPEHVMPALIELIAAHRQKLDGWA